MQNIINFSPVYFKDLYKLYCRAHNLPLKFEYNRLPSTMLSDYNGDKIKLLSIDGRIRGYIFFSKPYDNFYRDRMIIDEIFIQRSYSTRTNYITLLDSTKINTLFRRTRYAQIHLNTGMIKPYSAASVLDLTLEKKSFEMRTYLYGNSKIEPENNISFSTFKKYTDEGKRVRIQNSIFKDTRYHRDCSIDDILYEEGQDFFMDDGCIFIECDGETAGYSQVVLNKYPKEHPCIVNFGIIEKYRGHGLSKVLLGYTLNFIRQKGFKEAYINVDSDNYRAKNLYRQLGFDKINTYCTYLYPYSL